MSHQNDYDEIGKNISGWLSDTTAGGATTFFNGVDLVSPSYYSVKSYSCVQIRLWPTKGAAGFWYGTFTDGSKVCTLSFKPAKINFDQNFKNFGLN